MNDKESHLSSPVRSSQQGLHPQLERVVRKHMAHQWKAPVHEPTRDAFNKLTDMLDQEGDLPLVFDSGCGTGQSTQEIASIHADCLIIGIDQSISRLSRTGGNLFPYRQGNAVWLRAELGAFWQLAVQAGWRLKFHYILYPNPWPKPQHLLRRWHAHPAFPLLQSLGGHLEMRCNWKPYALEFSKALEMTGAESVSLADHDVDRISSPFERKYRNSGLPLFRVKADFNCSN